jgi:hypothetical protein
MSKLTLWQSTGLVNLVSLTLDLKQECQVHLTFQGHRAPH